MNLNNTIPAYHRLLVHDLYNPLNHTLNAHVRGNLARYLRSTHQQRQPLYHIYKTATRSLSLHCNLMQVCHLSSNNVGADQNESNTMDQKHICNFTINDTELDRSHMVCIKALQNPKITACAVATSCCISDVSSEWEGAIFDPP